ncbi:MAG: GFA family protein [Thiolinea sp.]
MIQGSCLCGQIEYEVELIPDKVFNCHCSYCRKAHGADYVTVALAKGDTLNIIKGQDSLIEHQNEIGGIRAFCANCGTRLMNYAPDKSLYLSVSASTIDTPIKIKPLAHVNVESKATWHEPYAGIPSFQALPENLLG